MKTRFTANVGIQEMQSYFEMIDDLIDIVWLSVSFECVMGTDAQLWIYARLLFYSSIWPKKGLHILEVYWNWLFELFSPPKVTDY